MTTPFGNDELERVLGVSLPATDGGAALRFVQEAVAWQKDWLKAHQQAVAAGQVGDETVALLIYAENPRLAAGVAVADAAVRCKETVYRHALDRATTGAIVCNENLATMRRVRLGWKSVSEAIQFAASALKDDQCFVVVVFGQARMLVHLPGQDVATWCTNPARLTVNAIQPPITPTSIVATIHRFAADNLLYPTASVAACVWLKGKPFKLSYHPENLIQTILLVHLKAYFHCSVTFVDEEVRSPGGRADLRIARAAPTGGPYPTVTTMIELKVLSAAKSLQKNRDWALKGIEQAASYRKADTDAAIAWLFDARKTKTALGSSLTKAARQTKVRLESSLMLGQRPTLGTAQKPGRTAAKKGRRRPSGR